MRDTENEQEALTEQHTLRLPDAPATERGPVKAWQQEINIFTYLPEAPDPNPMFFEKRVYQGSSGRVYPLPFIDRIATEGRYRSWKRSTSKTNICASWFFRKLAAAFTSGSTR